MSTGFKRWREQMAWTQDEAAQRLDVSKSQIANWDAGTNRGSGQPAVPPLATRKLMTALAMGSDFQAWPED